MTAKAGNKKLKNSKWQEKWLIGSYALVAIVFVILNVTAGQKEGLLNLVINLGMLLLAGVIYLWTLQKWNALNAFADDLAQVTKKIKADSIRYEGEYLWKEYKKQEPLFKSAGLRSIYGDFVKESLKKEEAAGRIVAGDIESYINDSVIGKIVSRNVMNQMPGVLTGLGILGTFLGLSIGLQNFTTDSSEAIMQSIPALMDGIKVAFHTSVYGMILSLSYNILYKRKLEWAENEMDEFLSAFEEKVLPNPQDEAMSILLEYQEQQSQQMSEFAQNLGRQVAEGMGEALAQTLAPQFDRFDRTIQRFTEMASQNQTEGMSRVVDSFVNQMNYALGDKFNALGQMIDQSCQTQQNNVQQMQALMNQNGDMAGNIQEIAGVSQRMIEEMESYIRRLENLQGILNENFASAGAQLANTQKLIEEQNSYVAHMSEAQTELAKAEQEFASLMSEQRYATKESFDGIAARIAELDGVVKSDMTGAAQELRMATDGLSPKFMESLQRTFGLFDRNLADIENHLSATITQIHNETKRVPIVVAQSYEGMEKSLNEVNKAMTDLTLALQAQN